MKNNQSTNNLPKYLSNEDFMNEKHLTTELQFRFENKCFSINRAVQSKCDCCDAKVITFFGEELV